MIPRTYLISREGKICFTSTGYSEEEFEALQRELAVQLGISVRCRSERFVRYFRSVVC